MSVDTLRAKLKERGEKKVLLAAMLWEYSRESNRLKQAILETRAVLKRPNAGAQPTPSPAEYQITFLSTPIDGGPFALPLFVLAENCPSWPEKAAEDCGHELDLIARKIGILLYCCWLWVPNKTKVKFHDNRPALRLEWRRSHVIYAEEADDFPLGVVRIDWRLSNDEIAKQIAAFRPEQFKDYAVGKKGKPIVDEKLLPETPENALDALDTLRKFKECGEDWPTYFAKHPHPPGQAYEVARTAALRECNTARKLLAWIEAESIPKATK
jgi:hypothetical protein